MESGAINTFTQRDLKCNEKAIQKECAYSRPYFFPFGKEHYIQLPYYLFIKRYFLAGTHGKTSLEYHHTAAASTTEHIPERSTTKHTHSRRCNNAKGQNDPVRTHVPTCTHMYQSQSEQHNMGKLAKVTYQL